MKYHFIRPEGFLANLFCDRSETKKEETTAIAENLSKQSDLSSKLSQIEGPTPEEEAANKKKLKSKGNFEHMPTPDQVGCNDHIARLAATLTSQMYDLYDSPPIIDKYELSTEDHEATVIIQDSKGILRPTNPPFAAALSGDTMLLCWRGSHTPTDFINDVASSPCTNLALGPYGKSIKLQGGMSSLAQNDIATYQDEIIDECKKRGIKNIVCTGHSLGGAIGQIAHIIIRAQMKDEHSPWHELKDRVQIQSLAFSAPMTLQITEEGMSEACQDFIDEIDEYSSNVVYHNDIVPRCYGFGSYMSAAIDDYASCVGQMLLDGQRFPFRGTKFLIDRVAVQVASTAEKSAMAKDLVGVWSNYVHPGTVVSYESFKAFPKTLKDYGAFHKNTGGKDTFRSVTYDPVGRGHNAILEISENHNSPWIGMKYSDDKLS